MDEDDPEVFEIDDFTASSDWERFIYRIEEIIGPNGWKLDNTEKRISISQHPKNADGKTTNIVDKSLSNKWESKYDVLAFSGFKFVLTHYKLNHSEASKLYKSHLQLNEDFPQALNDAFDMQYDFASRTHKIARWHGVKEFMILNPMHQKDFIDSESRTKLLWSSVGIALSNTKCKIPIFIQTGHFDRHLYYGMCLGSGFRTSFEMIHLKHIPHQCNHVQGMIETFRSKLACLEKPTINISIRFLYIIYNWKVEIDCFDIPDDIDLVDDRNPFTTIPFAPIEDPVSSFQVAAVWPSISSDCLVDNETYSELNPTEAPVWKLKVKSTNTLTSINQYLQRFLNLCQTKCQSTTQIIRSLSQENNADEVGLLQADISNVLDRLAEPVPILAKPIANAVTSATRKIVKSKLNDSPLSEDVLNAAMKNIFPDAWCQKEEFLKLQQKLNEEQISLECDTLRSNDKYRHFKSAPVNSLTYKLAITSCMINAIYGTNGMAHLWHEFILEMRYRYENEILIPALAQNPPNLNYCLIHQKLQMLNCCIQKRIKRSSQSLASSNEKIDSTRNDSTDCDPKDAVSYKDFMKNKPSIDDKRDSSWKELLANIDTENKDSNDITGDSDNDEFFEAQETFSDGVCQTNEDIEIDNNYTKKPQGILEETSMKLLKTGVPLCVPVTQQPPPLTEDMFVEQEVVLRELGTSGEAAKIRAQMQSASLLSDMESFKAANLECMLEDFVRWYSPNDWIKGPETEKEKEELAKLINRNESASSKEDESSGWECDEDDIMQDIEENENEHWRNEGHLSLRMRMPGNIWQEMWSTARPVPAKHQKRLFDDTKEAEKVLHYLGNLSLADISLQLFPALIQESLTQIYKHDDSSKFSKTIDEVLKGTSKIYNPTLDDVPAVKGILNNLHTVEHQIFLRDSLRMKFGAIEKRNSDIEELIEDTLHNDEVELKGGATSNIGKLIRKHLEYQQEVIDSSSSMEPKNNEGEQTKRKIPYPVAREYILRTMINNPSLGSRLCPQRLYTVITYDEFRMAGMFTKDTNFI